MKREVHVRFWEGLGVRFPWATQLLNHLETTRFNRLAFRTRCEQAAGLPKPCYSCCLPSQASRSALATLVCHDFKPTLRPGSPRLTLLAAAAQQTD